jgi:hypothetical protein
VFVVNVLNGLSQENQYCTSITVGLSIMGKGPVMAFKSQLQVFFTYDQNFLSSKIQYKLQEMPL